MAKEEVKVIYSLKDNAKKGLKGLLNRFLDVRLAILGVATAITGIVVDFSKLQIQMINVGNLFNASRDQVNAMTSELIKLSKTTPQSIGDLADSLFDTVSAGVKASESIEFVGVAAKLATAGVTTTKIAVDGLTSIMNAYNLEASEATMISDKLFAAQQFGKTTIAELSQTIGRLAPITKAAGISIDEMLGSVSALTRAGIRTDIAVVGMRAAISAIIKPTTEAIDAAEELGIEFDAQSIKAKGLSGFLKEVVEKVKEAGIEINKTAFETKGFNGIQEELEQSTSKNIKALATLFGNIRGLTAVLALASDGFETLNEGIKRTTESIGTTEKANNEAMESMRNQFKLLINNILSVGRAFMQKLEPAITTILTKTNQIIKLILKADESFMKFFNTISLNPWKKVISEITKITNKFIKALTKADGVFVKFFNTISLNPWKKVVSGITEVKDKTKNLISSFLGFKKEIEEPIKPKIEPPKEPELPETMEKPPELKKIEEEIIPGEEPEKTPQETMEENEQRLREEKERLAAIEEEFRQRKLKAIEDAKAKEKILNEKSKKDLFSIEEIFNKNVMDIRKAVSKYKKDLRELEKKEEEEKAEILKGFFLDISRANIKSVDDAIQATGAALKDATIKTIAMRTQAAVMNALATVQPFIPNALIAAGKAAILGAVASSAVSAISMADGGVVPGNSFTGDKVPIRANSGEVFVNPKQQANLLFSMANNPTKFIENTNQESANTSPREIIIMTDDGTELTRAIAHKQNELKQTGVLV
ncbi:MAG: phage tail tape measure protein [Candidatus Thorarchaeota archaeon]